MDQEINRCVRSGHRQPWSSNPCPFNPRENSLLRPLQLTVSRCEHHSDSDHAGRDHSNGNWCHGRRLSSCLQRLERTISEITGKIGPVGCGLEGASQMRTAVSFRIRCAAVRTLLEGLNSWLLPHREALHSLVIQDEARAPYTADGLAGSWTPARYN